MAHPEINTWIDAIVIERHVFLVHDQPANTFLPVPRREFVTKFRSSRLSDEDFDQSLVILCVADHDLVNISSYR